MDEKQCEIYRERFEERLDTHDKRLDSHSERIKELENHKCTIDERIDNLIKKIDDLVDATKWLKRCVTATIISAVVGFIIQLIIKR